MHVSDAREIAQEWITKHAASQPGFRGALWHGSILTLRDDAELSRSSDIDIMVIADDPSFGISTGKRLCEGLLLDVTVMRWEQVRDPEAILANHHLAPSFCNPKVIADPAGDLARIQEIVGREFPRRAWVEKRCASARGKITGALGSLSPSRPFHENVMAWLFGTGITTHVLLVAGLRNPTVRKRYLAVRELLDDYGLSEEYDPLLALLGCAGMTRADVEAVVPPLADAYDVATMVIQSSFFFGSDISISGRPIAIGGTHELIDGGNHREAIFWMVATWARCMMVFHADAPEQVERFDPAFRDLLALLGIESLDDMQRRAAEVEAYLPHIDALAARIIAATPEITS